MRTARIKPFAADADGTYYHLVNRVSGSPNDYPFGEIEKEKLLKATSKKSRWGTLASRRSTCTLWSCPPFVTAAVEWGFAADGQPPAISTHRARNGFMKKTLHALVPLADGFEELEAVAILDVLRRAGVETAAAAVSGTPTVTGSHQLTLTADLALTTAATRSWDAVVLPGGLPGSRHLAASPLLLELLRQTAAAGGVVAALCAAPLALHAAGLLAGRRFTCYPAQHPNIVTGTYTGNRVETDGQLVTGKAAGAAVEFAFAVLRALNLNEQADQLTAAMFTPTEPVSA